MFRDDVRNHPDIQITNPLVIIATFDLCIQIYFLYTLQFLFICWIPLVLCRRNLFWFLHILTCVPAIIIATWRYLKQPSNVCLSLSFNCISITCMTSLILNNLSQINILIFYNINLLTRKVQNINKNAYKCIFDPSSITTGTLEIP